MEILKEKIAILSKLMNETPSQITDLDKRYNNLYKTINDQLYKHLDEGDYFNNSGIVTVINKVIDEKEIFLRIPSLFNRSIISFYGDSKLINNFIKPLCPELIDIKYNSNLPLVIIPSLEYENPVLCAINYLNKEVILSESEFKYLTSRLYKDKIDVRKLIKMFVLYVNGNYLNQAYAVFPQYILNDNSIMNLIDSISVKKYLIIDKNNDWKRARKNIKDEVIYCLEYDHKIESKLIGFNSKMKRVDINDFYSIIQSLDGFQKNMYPRVQLENILLDIDIFYIDKIENLKKQIKQLKGDGLYFSEEQKQDNKLNLIFKESDVYKNKLLNELELSNENYENYISIKNKILELAIEFEDSFGSVENIKLEENKKLIDELVLLMFKHVAIKDFNEAERDIYHLHNLHYQFSTILTIYLKYKKTNNITLNQIEVVKQCSTSNEEISKIKVEMVEILKLEIDEIFKILQNISTLNTKKEYYYNGLYKISQNKINVGIKYLLRALELGFEKAGEQLIQLKKNNSQINIDYQKLTEYSIPEANYILGQECINSNRYAAGIVYLKVAASKGHLGAMEKLVEEEYLKCQKISYRKIDESKDLIYNVIEMLDFLNDKCYRKENDLKKGILLYKVKEYTKAYSLLKEFCDKEAQYLCGKMCQYGEGVAKDLTKAKEYFKKVPLNYKDTKKHYDKVCDQIKLNEEKAKKEYKEDYNYSSSSYSSSYDDSFCFITTATCLALNKGDNCDELNFLRKFRDTYLRNDGQDGNELITEYYRIGPIIVNHIREDQNSAYLYNYLWKNYIYPTYEMIENNKKEEAKQMYILMVKYLCEKYNVKVIDSIKERYCIGSV